MKTTTEQFKNIKGYEGLYQISNLGNVKSVRNDIILIPDTNINGYKTVCLSKNGEQKVFRVHRLVLDAFTVKTHFSLVANHINGKRDDNRLENLEWVTQKENVRKGKRSIRVKDLITGKEYSCIKEVAETLNTSYNTLIFAIKSSKSNYVII